MPIPKELTNSILQSVLDKVKLSMTPTDDTPDDDENVAGLVKRTLNPDQDREEGILGLLQGALSGATDKSDSQGGLGDLLGGLLGGAKQNQEQPQQSGGLMDLLGGILGGDKQEDDQPQQSGNILGALLQSIGGEGALGGILGHILQKQGVTAEQLTSEGKIPNSVMDSVVDLLKDGVLNKVQSNLKGGQSQQSSILDSVLNLVKPDR